MYKIENLDYISLEPYIDNNTIRYHRILENRYLDKLNELLIKNNYNYQYSMEELVNKIDIFPISDRNDILYNLGGVLNHELYFNSISNYKRNIPIGDIKDAINKEFGSYNNFKKTFITTASKLVGSGYTFLVLDKNKHLKIISLSNQDTPYSYGFIPIIALDLWEHSFYLKYNVNKKDYINNFFEIIDFTKIDNIYKENI